MARRTVLILLSALMALCFCGCASIFEAEYSYSEAYGDESEKELSDEEIDIKSYSQLKNALLEMVTSAQANGKIRFSSYSGSVVDDMAAACYEVKTQTPMGAYAVEDLDYALNRIVSYYTAEINIAYKRTTEEIEGVVTINGVTSLKNYMAQAISEGREKLTIRMYSAAVNAEYIQKVVSSAYYDDPLLTPSRPETETECYPSEGLNRIYDIQIIFPVTQAESAEMGQKLADLVNSACAEIDMSNTGAAALDCALYLNRCCTPDDTVTKALDTAYGALALGRAGAEGMAMAYKAMCDRLGIECLVVRGALGAMDAQEHYWNIIGINGEHYHVDVSRFAADGAETAFLMKDADIWGRYIWATGEYPVCDGDLKSSDFIKTEPVEDGPASSPESGATPAPGGEPEPGGEPTQEPSPPLPTPTPEVQPTPETETL